MGFEQVIPSVPTRDQEIRALEKLQKSWLNQGYFQYFMNEDFRTVKMKMSHLEDSVNVQFAVNFFLGLLLSLPFTYAARRFYIFGSTGVPLVPRLTAFIRQRTALQHRQFYYYKSAFIFSFVGSLFFASAFTKDQRTRDDNFNRAYKNPVMM